MTDTLSIIGACSSEDWIHFRDFSRAFDFALPPLRQHSSLLSIVSKASPVPDGLFEGLSAWEQAQLRADFDKSFLVRLVEARPRVLIIDFAIDAMSGVIRHGEGYITRSFLLRKSPLFGEFKMQESMKPSTRQENYLREFSFAARMLGAFMARKLPDCQIVLHKNRFAETIVDKAGVVRRWPERPLQLFQSANQSLPLLEEAFQRHVRCDVISLLDETWHADQGHMWGAGGMHFERRYYRRFHAELGKLMAGDSAPPGTAATGAPR